MANRMLRVKSKLGDKSKRDTKKIDKLRKRDAKSTRKNNKNIADSNAGKTVKRKRRGIGF